MIIFHNPGHIEPNAFRLMGASVKNEGSFGRFGTGLKYAVATILRGGGTITVHSGERTFGFVLEATSLKDREFSEVVLFEKTPDGYGANYQPLGFTDRLGRDWEPWMVIRELGCNARDEGGDFQLWEDEEWGPSGDGTEIVVRWGEVEENWTEVLASTFAPAGETLLEENGVRVLPGPSDYLYHRGVRVWKLPRPSVFTYDVTSEVDLTEDRTVKYSFCVVADVRNAILATADRSIIAGAVTAGSDRWEGTFDWTGTQWHPRDPGPDWLEEVALLRDKRHAVSKSAADVMLSHSAIKTATHYAGGTYEEMAGSYGEVVERLEGIGIELKDLKTFVVEALPESQKSTVRNGAIYVTKETLEESPSVELAEEVLRRFLELKSGGSHDALLDFVVPLLLSQDYQFRIEREEIEANAKREIAA